jgi:hypothetical protein
MRVRMRATHVSCVELVRIPVDLQLNPSKLSEISLISVACTLLISAMRYATCKVLAGAARVILVGTYIAFVISDLLVNVVIAEDLVNCSQLEPQAGHSGDNYLF